MASTEKHDGANHDSKPNVENSAAVAAARPASPIASEKHGQLYTRNAEQGLNAAELINSALKKCVVGSALPRRVEVAPPSGPSTSGGRKARQTITLVQTSAQGPAVMIGFLDPAQKLAGIRDYGVVAKQYEARFHSVFETTSEEYGVLTKELVGMLATLGHKIVSDEPREDGRSSAPGPPPPAFSDSRKPIVIAASVVAAALLALLLTRC